MRDNDFVASLIPKLRGHIRADDGVEQIAERRARSEFERLPMPVMVDLK